MRGLPVSAISSIRFQQCALACTLAACRGPTITAPMMQFSGGLNFKDDERSQLLISAQKPLGLLLEEEDGCGGCIVADLADDGSASRAGVRCGDSLLAVNNADVTQASLEEVVSMLQQAPRVVNLRFARKHSRGRGNAPSMLAGTQTVPPAEAWVFPNARVLYQPAFVPIAAARAATPQSLTLLSFAGWTLGGVFVAEWTDRYVC